MTDLPTDIRQVSVNRVTIGVILSSALLAGSISWSASRLVSRLDAVEVSVEAIQEAMEEAPYARVEDVAEDLDDLWLEVDTLGERLEDLTDSVSFLLMVEDRGLDSTLKIDGLPFKPTVKSTTGSVKQLTAHSTISMCSYHHQKPLLEICGMNQEGQHSAGEG